MTPAYDSLLQQLKRLPGLGYRSAERVAMHLLVEKPDVMGELLNAMTTARDAVGRCKNCGNMAESELCAICEDANRDRSTLCVVEHVPDLIAIERSSAWKAQYHVLHGKLSPIHGIGPEQLNFQSLQSRIESDEVTELVLAL
mgnify:FL=1